MAKRSIWQRLSAANTNLEQFRSELADETQIAAALPEDARMSYLKAATQAEPAGGMEEAPDPEADYPQDLEQDLAPEQSPTEEQESD